MTAKLMVPLRRAPATVPALAALALFLVWATDQAGYPLTHWAPGGLIVMLLLGIAVALVRVRLAEIPRPVLLASGALAAYTALSFLSILWARDAGDAFEGADRTLLYLLVFVLFGCWRQHGESAALLLGAWTLAMIGFAVFTVLHLDAASASQLAHELPGGRLDYPTGYPNANAALWLMACWPAILLARSPRLHPLLRAALAGGAVLLAEVALLSQSRGSLYATPVMVVLVFALLPERRRTFVTLLPVAGAIAVAAPTVLRVGDHLRDGAVTEHNLHAAILASGIAAAAIALLVGAVAAGERRARLTEAGAARVGTAVGVLAAIALLGAIGGGLAVTGNPISRVESGWHSFKGGYGDSKGTDRLVSGLGSNRYDFFRVSLDEFLAHPVAGIGADNFQQQYLQHGRSSETPHYPHSIELRTLVQGGVIGALIALVGLGGALLAGWRALRSPDPLARSVAAAAFAGFGYWGVHGSFDWFFEFAALGAPAFAMLGLVCALAPPREPAAPRKTGVGRLVPVFAGVAALAVTAAFAGPWLSQLQVQSAARVWTRSPRAAYARLGDAARLNPFSDEAYLVAGSIALRLGETERADGEFARALKRTPDDAYATLERGAIASERGEAKVALALLERARKLNPRDELTRAVAAVARDGNRVSVEELNRSILLKAQELS